MIFELFLGLFVGFSLGLTGGGGATFAVPLLVYGLGVEPRAAVEISLMTIAATAVAGFLLRARLRQVEFPTGFLFAGAGALGTPIGARIATHLPDALLLGLFSALMLAVAIRMWLRASVNDREFSPVSEDDVGPACKRDPEGRLRMTTQCGIVLALVGIGAGILTGLFGVGGGFIIVPALMMFTGMNMQRAIGTSLLVISIVSFVGLTVRFSAPERSLAIVAILFTLGSLAGVFAGARLSRAVSGVRLQKTFAAAIVLVAVYVLLRSQLS